MTPKPELIAVNANNFDSLPCCGIKSPTHPGRQQKRSWLQANAEFGLCGKILVAPDGRPSGYIEYLPGEYAWRAVNAAGYLFIHCVWVHSKKHQHRGWATFMLEDCLAEARRASLNGVAVLVRDGPWLAGRQLFLANAFEAVATAPPDYQLLVRKFRKGANPSFKTGWEQKLTRYRRGLTIVRCNQCPYSAKFTAEIAAVAEEHHIEPRIVELNSWRDAQDAPTPYAVFSIIHNGQLLADHQISQTRFRNILKRLPPT